MTAWIKFLLFKTTDDFFVQLFRYVFVGGLAFLVDYGLLFALTEYVGLHYLLSATCSFLAGLIVNYLISITWIFNQSKLKNKWMEFTIFGLIGVVGLGLNNLFLYLLTDKLGVHYMISKIVVAAIVMLWNFIARKVILFKNK